MSDKRCVDVRQGGPYVSALFEVAALRVSPPQPFKRVCVGPVLLQQPVQDADVRLGKWPGAAPHELLL